MRQKWVVMQWTTIGTKSLPRVPRSTITSSIYWVWPRKISERRSWKNREKWVIIFDRTTVEFLIQAEINDFSWLDEEPISSFDFLELVKLLVSLREVNSFRVPVLLSVILVVSMWALNFICSKILFRIVTSSAKKTLKPGFQRIKKITVSQSQGQ